MNMGTRQDDWVNEYDASSKLLDAPIEMVKCETSDIMVPADAEMIIEGTVSATQSLPEGPFGEYPGYMFTEHKHAVGMAKMDIHCMTFRSDPIIPIAIPSVPPDSTHVAISFFTSSDTIAHLKREGFPVIDGGF